MKSWATVPLAAGWVISLQSSLTGLAVFTLLMEGTLLVNATVGLSLTKPHGGWMEHLWLFSFYQAVHVGWHSIAWLNTKEGWTGREEQCETSQIYFMIIKDNLLGSQNIRTRSLGSPYWLYRTNFWSQRDAGVLTQNVSKAAFWMLEGWAVCSAPAHCWEARKWEECY